MSATADRTRTFGLPVLSVALLAVGLLSGCTPTPQAAAGPSSASSPAAEDRVETAPETDEPSDDEPGTGRPGAEGAGDANPCRTNQSGPANGQELDPAWFDGMEDLGPREGANGTVTLGEDGKPAAYVVASGDSFGAVAQRVCTFYYGLQALNAVRRNGMYGDFGDSMLYVGDTLNLNPHTIVTVGDQNGVVYDHDPVFVLPEQW